jgi:hypothetical protein
MGRWADFAEAAAPDFFPMYKYTEVSPENFRAFRLHNLDFFFFFSFIRQDGIRPKKATMLITHQAVPITIFFSPTPYQRAPIV